MRESPIPPGLARYSTGPFPAYRFRLGETPHPRRHPKGHSFGCPEPAASAFPPEGWHRSQDFLYAVDLYNFGYWWESHEGLESLWHAVGRHSEQGQFFRALIQLAAAHLKRAAGSRQAASNLMSHAVRRLQAAPPHYMGIDVRKLVQEIDRRWAASDAGPVLIRLAMPARG